jgi:hypothetical protein
VTPNPNVLWFTICPDWMKPPPLSTRLVVAGPDRRDLVEDGVVRSIRAVGDTFDVAAQVARLPAAQRPDLVVVETDAFSFGVCAARNLAPLDCPKLLIVGDTHHGPAPLQGMLDYALAGGFDRIALSYTAHHVHWFAERCGVPVTFLPGLHIAHVPVAFGETREPVIGHVGQTGQFHLRRRRLLEAVTRAGLPVTHRRGTALEIARAYATQQITWNCSLNGDFSLKHFEVLGAGGFLVSDRLSAASGIDRLLTDGEHYVSYGAADELVDTLRHYLARPADCLRIARAGQAVVLAQHTPAARARELLDFAFGRTVPDLGWDPRARPLPEAARARMGARLRLYEFVQELHRTNETVDILCASRLPETTRADLSDLPRCRLHDVADAPILDDALRRRPWDVVIASFSDLARAPAKFDGLAPAWFASLDAPSGMVHLEDYLAGRFEMIGLAPWLFANRAVERPQG